MSLFQGDYDLVITDYARARSLFGDTEVEVFKKGKAFSISDIFLFNLMQSVMYCAPFIYT